MIKEIMSFFGKKKCTPIMPVSAPMPNAVCETCPRKETCIHLPINPVHACDFEIEMPEMDDSKKTLLIIDDNPGIVSFLKDDILALQEKNIVPTLNIITVSGKDAAYQIGSCMDNENNKISIDYAIIDITYGGSKILNKQNVKFNGVDVFEIINNSNLKHIFFTGNNLNPYIKQNKLLIDKYCKLTGENIMDYVLFKTSLDMDSRQSKIAKTLFGNKDAGI
jgi:hypothetical protein